MFGHFFFYYLPNIELPPLLPSLAAEQHDLDVRGDNFTSGRQHHQEAQLLTHQLLSLVIENEAQENEGD